MIFNLDFNISFAIRLTQRSWITNHNEYHLVYVWIDVLLHENHELIIKSKQKSLNSPNYTHLKNATIKLIIECENKLRSFEDNEQLSNFKKKNHLKQKRNEAGINKTRFERVLKPWIWGFWILDDFDEIDGGNLLEMICWCWENNELNSVSSFVG
jgi:GT2 family glycosyltransferase